MTIKPGGKKTGIWRSSREFKAHRNRSLGDIDDDTTGAVGGEAPPEGILNALFF